MLSAIKDKFAAVKQKYQTDTRFKKISTVTVVIVFAIVGVVLAGISMASSPTAITPQLAQSKACGARVSNYSYQVPFGNAPWNVPVCDLPKHPRSAEYAGRMFNYGIYNDETPSTANNKGKFTVSFGFESADKNWTRAVYYASDATTTRQVQVCGNGCSPSNLDDGKGMYDIEGFLPNRKFPWNPRWEVAAAGDNELIIIDEQKGHLYSFASVKTGPLAVAQCGPFYRERLCASSARILRDHHGNIADYRTFEGSDGSRGGGINYFATLLTPQEVKAGEIRHALGMGIYNTAFGPACTKEQLAKNDPKVIDITCGTAVAPAAKYEWPSVSTIGERIRHHQGLQIDKVMTLSKTVPEGMRFALDIDDTFIENWINSRPDLKSSPRKAETARIIARALRDYGWMPLDTSGYGAGIQTAGGMSEKNRKLWQELGITSEKDDNILHGLFTKDNIYTVAPPTNNCTDGTKSTFYCKYHTSTYDTSTSRPAPQPPTQTPSTPTNNDPSGGDPAPTPTQPPTTSDPVPQPAPSTPNPNPPVSPQPATGTTITPMTAELPKSIPVQIGWDWDMFEFHQGAQLTWSASSSPHGIKQYVIKKNGKIIYKGSGRSYTDFRIDDGQRYNYELTAVDNKGNVSKTSSFEGTVRCTWFGWSCGFEKK